MLQAVLTGNPKCDEVVRATLEDLAEGLGRNLRILQEGARTFDISGQSALEVRVCPSGGSMHLEIYREADLANTDPQPCYKSSLDADQYALLTDPMVVPPAK